MNCICIYTAIDMYSEWKVFLLFEQVYQYAFYIHIKYNNKMYLNFNRYFQQSHSIKQASKERIPKQNKHRNAT